MMEARAPIHRWSGWPGAWCLDCGAEDPFEIAMADGDVDYVDNPADPDGHPAIEFKPGVRERCAAAMVCPEPGSNRHNPYTANKGPRDDA